VNLGSSPLAYANMGFVLTAFIFLQVHPWCVLLSFMQQEFANRLAVLNSDYLQQLVALLHTHSLAKNSSLQVPYTISCVKIVFITN